MPELRTHIHLIESFTASVNIFTLSSKVINVVQVKGEIISKFHDLSMMPLLP